MARSQAGGVFGSLALAVLLLLGSSSAVNAEVNFVREKGVLSPTKLTMKPIVSETEPVLLSAEHIDYEHGGEVVVADGKVEISQGDTIMLADQIIYNRSTGMVTAHGNIAVLEPSGNVYFADDLELYDSMRAGVVKEFKTRLVDDSLLTSAMAERKDENVTTMDKAVYSPCKVHCTKVGNDPLWQIRASSARMDKREQTVAYEDARFEVYGVPIFYTPYFSHAMPGAPNESGLLIPQYQHTSQLGAIYRQPLYYSIAPDKDLTLTPAYVSKEKPVLGAEYRQAFDTGKLRVDGSVTNPRARDDFGNLTSGHDVRGHMNAMGKFTPTPYRNWGFDLRRTSDDTYLRRHSLGQDTLLTSRAYLEDFRFIGGNDRTYGSLQAVSFQGLTAADKGTRIPFALPMADFNYQSEPGRYNSRFFVDMNALALHRQTGADTRRMSGTVGWKLPYVTDSGHVLELNTQLRNDIYHVNSSTLSNGENFEGITGRVVPQADATWRYPLVNRLDSETSVMVEPVVNVAVSPKGGNPEEIPNEDSLVPEFTDSNLFNPNRFAGYDRVESGPRMSYGLRGQAQVLGDKYLDVMLGQNYRMNNDPNFPFSNDLYDHNSDYVGKVGVTSLPVTVAYRFRLDKETLSAKRNEVDLGVVYKPVSLNVAYLSLDNDPVLATKEEVAGAAVYELDEQWSLMASGRRDMELDQTTSVYSGVTYRNECVNVSAILGREFTHDRDIESSTNFLVKLSLKNID